MTIEQHWADRLALAEDLTGRRYEVGEKITEYDGRESTLRLLCSASGGSAMAAGDRGGDHTTVRVPWTYVTDQIRALADKR